MHDPVEKYTPGRTHDGTIFVWIHPGVVGNRTQHGRLARIKRGWPKVKFCKKYGAIRSEIAKTGLMPRGLHGTRRACRTMIGRQAGTQGVRSRGDWRCASADPIHTCRVEPIVACAEAAWDEQLDDAELHTAWRRQQLETIVEQSQRSHGRHHHVLGTTGVDLAASHDFRHSKRTRGGPARNAHHGRQDAGMPGTLERVGRMVDARGGEQGRTIRTPVFV